MKHSACNIMPRLLSWLKVEAADPTDFLLNCGEITEAVKHFRFQHQKIRYILEIFLK